MSVKLYTTPVCPYCQSLKNFLGENKIVFKEIDVSKDEQALQEMIKNSGQYSVPVLNIDGQIVVGFDREKICQLLKI